MAWWPEQDLPCAGCNEVKQGDEKRAKPVQGEVCRAEVHQADGLYPKGRAENLLSARHAQVDCQRVGGCS